MTYESEEMALGAFLGAYLGMVCLFIIVITVLSIIANWKVYTKAGREGWKCLIPVYNVYVLSEFRRIPPPLSVSAGGGMNPF